jgi:hypothetical protein
LSLGGGGACAGKARYDRGVQAIRIPWLAVTITAVLAACGGKVSVTDEERASSAGLGGESGGGSGEGADAGSGAMSTSSAGDTTAASSTSASSSAATTSIAASSSTGPVQRCDQGLSGNATAIWCKECQQCALDSVCAMAVESCQASPDCVGYYECLQQCDTCPRCEMAYPGGKVVYDALIDCLLCNCVSDCGVTDSCGER